MSVIQFYNNKIKQKLYFEYFTIKWRKRNKHNFTYPKSAFNISHVEVGKKTYGELNVVDQSPSDNKVIIGSYCSIAPNVWFLLGGEHNIHTISTYPFKTLVFSKGREAGSKGNIIIEDDVWVGMNSTICSGVTIGKGVVVAANSVVTKDIPPYTIVAGVPARVIKERFSEKVKSSLLEIDLPELFNKFKEEDLEKIYSDNDEVIISLINKYK